MFAGQELARLKVRKQDLLTESEGQRRALQAAWTNVLGMGTRISQVRTLVQTFVPLWFLGASVAGFLAFLCWRKPAKVLPKVCLGLKLLRMAYSVRTRFRAS